MNMLGMNVGFIFDAADLEEYYVPASDQLMTKLGILGAVLLLIIAIVVVLVIIINSVNKKKAAKKFYEEGNFGILDVTGTNDESDKNEP
ncbi:MAG: hypothetical protein MJ119_08000 [Lachnospiraceae bacterium]|nr:hypothetical protein [Lachnospiraceae bacterium]